MRDSEGGDEWMGGNNVMFRQRGKKKGGAGKLVERKGMDEVRIEMG